MTGVGTTLLVGASILPWPLALLLNQVPLEPMFWDHFPEPISARKMPSGSASGVGCGLIYQRCEHTKVTNTTGPAALRIGNFLIDIPGD
jgi:hypothetical protein